MRSERWRLDIGLKGPGKLGYVSLEYIEIGHAVDRIAYISRVCKTKPFSTRRVG
jgi:hypothetical protein